MSRQRKYPTTTDYWVYVHRTPDNMYYPGQSKTQVHRRWKPSQYHNMSLQPYIDQYGWDNIEHLVVKDGLTKEQALYWEDQLIQMYTQMGCCINQRRSGHCTADMKTYNRQYMKKYEQQPERKEYKRLYSRQYSQQPEVKVYKRVKNYNRYHTPIETPLEAKKKYLEYGYIPQYIKSDDLV